MKHVFVHLSQTGLANWSFWLGRGKACRKSNSYFNCFSASLKDHEETLKPDQRKAKILQGPVSQIIKTQKLERPRIELIAQLLGQTVRQG